MLHTMNMNIQLFLLLLLFKAPVALYYSILKNSRKDTLINPLLRWKMAGI